MENDNNHHILNEDMTETLCGVESKDLPRGTPIITLDGYRRGTELPICASCEKAEGVSVR